MSQSEQDRRVSDLLTRVVVAERREHLAIDALRKAREARKNAARERKDAERAFNKALRARKDQDQ